MRKVTINLLLFVLLTPVLQAASIDPNKYTVLITGANRGIGLEFTKHYVDEDWNVIATARSPDKADVLNSMSVNYENLIIEQLDVTDHARIDVLGTTYEDVAIDLLINNAGVLGATDKQALGNLDYEIFEQVMAVNVYAPMKMIEVFSDHVARSKLRKIVSISSGASELKAVRGNGLYFYRLSKTALNMVMRIAQSDLKQQGIIVITISPGMVDTDMLRTALGNRQRQAGMPQPISTKKSVDGMTSVIDSLDSSYDGSHMNYDGRELPW